MVQKLFDYPLPNNGDRYDLSEEELAELLQKAYDNGRQYNQEWSTYYWSNTICPKCGGCNVYRTTTAMYGPGNITTCHCSNCGYYWEE
jgi:hypothetical protein